MPQAAVGQLQHDRAAFNNPTLKGFNAASGSRSVATSYQSSL